MILNMMRSRLGIILGAALVGLILASAHLALVVWEPVPQQPWIGAVALALMAALGVVIIATLARRSGLTHHHQTIDNLAQQIEAWRDNPSEASTLPESLSDLEQTELAPLLSPLINLVASYRQALIEFIAVHETMDNLRLFQERVGHEKGFSLSFVASKDGVNRTGRRLVARLAPNLHWMAATPALQKFLGYDNSHLTARPFLEVVHPDDVSPLTRAFTDAIRDGEGHNVNFRVQVSETSVVASKAGESPDRLRFLQMDVVTRYTNEGEPLHLRCHFVDVTERIRTDRELRVRSQALLQANERLRQINADLQRLKEGYRDLYHNAPVLYFSLDARGHFVACNDTMTTSLGYGRQELLGHPYTRLLSPGHGKNGQAAVAADFRQARNFEARWIKRDGTLIDVWIHTSPVLDPQEHFLRSRSIAQDVTERNRLTGELVAKSRELEKANERLRRINQELDQFTYVVSHDLKEPLRTLEAFSTFLATDYGPQLGREGQGFIDHLVQASRRLGRLIDDLLRLSRVGRVLDTPRLFDIREPLETALSDLTARIESAHAVVRADESLNECPALWGDPQRVAELLANLIGNGLKYNHDPRPEVVVGVAQEREDEDGTDSSPVVTLFVRDNGIGIDPKYHEQVFGIFRRLHRREEYEGTGAGLAICKKIVEAHGGHIWIESRLGQGTTVLFTLPNAPPSAMVAAESELTESLAASIRA